MNRLVVVDRDNPQDAMNRLGQRLSDAAAGDVLQDAAAVVLDALRLDRVVIDLGTGRVASAGSLDHAGDAVELPLVFAGEQIGCLVAVPGPDRVLTPPERRLLRDIARQVATAAHAVTLTAELAARRNGW